MFAVAEGSKSSHDWVGNGSFSKIYAFVNGGKPPKYTLHSKYLFSLQKPCGLSWGNV
jgi:hypothetical protein